MRYAAIAVAFIATTAQAASELPPDRSGTYICKATAAGGLSYDKQARTWSSTTFDVGDSTYTVKVVSTGKIGDDGFGMKSRSYTISVKKFGSADKPAECYGPNRRVMGNEIITFGDRLECRFFGTDYVFNFESNRYLIEFEGGFIWGDEAGNTDTPYIEGGKCDKVD